MLDFGEASKVVVVLSGGIDSSVLLYSALDSGKSVSLFHGHYSKPSSQNELAFAKWASSHHRLPLEVVDMSGITSMQVGYVDPVFIAADEADMKAEQLGRDNVTSGFYTMVSAAAYYAQITDVDTVAFGLIRSQAERRPGLEESFGLFSDFIAHLNPTAPRLLIKTPLINHAKSEVVKLGQSLGVPFEKTWSCSSAAQFLLHCGVCSQCEERKQAFAEAGVDDPTQYKNNSGSELV